MLNFIDELVASKVPVGVLYQTFLDRYKDQNKFTMGLTLVEMLLVDNSNLTTNVASNDTTTKPNANTGNARGKLLLCEYFLHRLYENVDHTRNPFWGHILTNYVKHGWMRFIYFERDLGGFTVDMLQEKRVEYDLYGNWVNTSADNDRNDLQLQNQLPDGKTYYDEQYLFRVKVSEIYKVLEINQFYNTSEVFDILKPTDTIDILERLCCEDIIDDSKVLSLVHMLEASINIDGGGDITTSISKFSKNNNAADHHSTCDVENDGHHKFPVENSKRLETCFVRLLNINRTAKIPANLVLFERLLTVESAPAWLLDEYLTLLCTRLAPPRITNLTADFVNRLLHTTTPADVETRKRVISGVVLRWFESIENEKNEINLICLFLTASQQYIAETDSVFLYGQLLPYIGHYESAKTLYFNNMNGGFSTNNDRNNSTDTRSVIYS